MKITTNKSIEGEVTFTLELNPADAASLVMSSLTCMFAAMPEQLQELMISSAIRNKRLALIAAKTMDAQHGELLVAYANADLCNDVQFERMLNETPRFEQEREAFKQKVTKMLAEMPKIVIPTSAVEKDASVEQQISH